MKVTIENKKGLNKDLKVFVDKKTMNTYMNDKYEEITSSSDWEKVLIKSCTHSWSMHCVEWLCQTK